MTCALGTLTMIFTMDAFVHRCRIPVVDDDFTLAEVIITMTILYFTITNGNIAC